MAEITQYVKGNFPATYDKLKKEYTDPDIVEQTIGKVIAQYFVSGTTVADLDPFERSKSYIADVVTLELTPAAIDMWQAKAILSDNSKGEGISYYDRVDGLLALCEKIKARLKPGTLQSEVPDLVDPGAVPIPAVPTISTDGEGFKTDDPNLFEITDQMEDLGGTTESEVG